MPTDKPEELTDEEVQKKLAGEIVKGPRKFRGRELARYASGLRDVVMKVVRPKDTGTFHDAVLVHVLTEAYGATVEERLARRRALLAETDDVETFRAKLSIEIDELEDAEILELRRLVDEILAAVDAAQVAVATEPGKKNADAKAKRSRTKTHS